MVICAAMDPVLCRVLLEGLYKHRYQIDNSKVKDNSQQKGRWWIVPAVLHWTPLFFLQKKMLLKRNPQGHDYWINMCSSLSNQKPSIQTRRLLSLVPQVKGRTNVEDRAAKTVVTASIEQIKEIYSLPLKSSCHVSSSVRWAFVPLSLLPISSNS